MTSEELNNNQKGNLPAYSNHNQNVTESSLYGDARWRVSLGGNEIEKNKICLWKLMVAIAYIFHSMFS